MTLTTVPAKVTGDQLLASDWETYLKDNINGLIDAVGQQNRLINPGMEFAQRGAGPFSTNGQYTLDMWKIVLGTSSTISVTPETTTVDSNSKQSLKAVYTHSAASQIEQKLEDTKAVQGKTLSFSVRVRQGVAGAVKPYIGDSGAKTYGVVSATVGAFVTLTVTAAISANASAVTVGVELVASDTVYVDNATLTTGSAALPYVPFPPYDDLARCQRYYERASGGVSMLVAGIATAVGQSAYTTVAWKVAKAVSPTVTVVGTWGVTNCGQPLAANPDLFGVQCYVTANAAGVFYATGSATAYLAAEANP